MHLKKGKDGRDRQKSVCLKTIRTRARGYNLRKDETVSRFFKRWSQLPREFFRVLYEYCTQKPLFKMASIWMLFFAILASLEISVASEDCAAKAKVLNRQEEKACHK